MKGQALKGLMSMRKRKTRVSKAKESGRREKTGHAPVVDLSRFVLRGDTGRAELFAAIHDGKLLYGQESKKWFYYNGKFWVAGGQGQALYLTKEIHEIAEAWYTSLPPPQSEIERAERAEQAPWIEKCLTARCRRTMLSLAATEPNISVSVTAFDRDPLLLNCANGGVNLVTGKLSPHDPKWRATKMAPIGYDPDAQCPKFKEFVLDFCSGDQKMAEWLQRALGYSLTGDTGEQILILLWGSGGNGKTTLLQTIAEVMGSYAGTASRDTFLLSKGGFDKIPEDLDDLRGRRFVTSTEPNRGRWLDEELVKAVTGDEQIRTRKLRQNSSEWKPAFKLWIACNHKPQTSTCEALWRRLILVPCRAKFTDAHKRIRGYAKTLVEEEGPGILAWLVRGCQAWREHGLKLPQVIRQATAEYLQEMDVVNLFVEDACEQGREFAVQSSLLWGAYGDWCRGEGYKRLDNRRFAQELLARGFSKKRRREANYIIGLRVNIPAGTKSPA